LPTADYSLERIAQCYACDKRTLQRYLRDEADTNYQTLLDDVRFDLVQQYLRDSQMPVTQLTYVAGFSDPSNFARAFRKRFGMSPKQWREKHGASRLSSRTRRLSLR
jgi:AraC-like DNA-binding protein